MPLKLTNSLPSSNLRSPSSLFEGLKYKVEITFSIRKAFRKLTIARRAVGEQQFALSTLIKLNIEILPLTNSPWENSP